MDKPLVEGYMKFRRTRTTDGTLTTEYGYDAVGNLVRQANENVTLTYRYDLNHRMTEEARTEGGTTLRSGFAYDKAGQLTSFRRSDGYAEAYTYDPVGNMVEKVLNGTKIAMTYDAANELKTMESPHGKLTYIYDLNGNLTQKTLGDRTDTYSYDARNRLKQYRGYDNYQVKYSYNALGMLHARESSGNHSRTTLEELIAGKEEGDDPDGDDGSHITTYTYDLTQPYYQVLTETTDGATTAYTYGLERLAAYTENTRTAYLYDGRGSVIQTRGSLGTQTMAYSAYGVLLTEKTSGYGYNGEYYDAATGMLNLRARQYEPAQARFSQRDSLKGWVTSPRSLNAYLYCQNDAMNYFDASGAAMMAVNMTDGGGRSAAMRVSNVAATVATAVKQVTAAAVAKEANTHALTQAQVSSILKERNNPASVLQQARANRTKALENTPAVNRSNNIACMSQEEHDSFWTRLFNVLFPSSCAPKNTPEPTPSPTPNPTPTPLAVTVPEPPTIPTPAAATFPPGYTLPTPVPPSKAEIAIENAIERGLSKLGTPYGTKNGALDCSRFVRYAYVEYDDVFDDVKYYTASWQIYNYVRGKTKDKTGPDKWDYFSIEKGEQPIIPDGAIIFYGDGNRIHHVALAYDGKMIDSSTDKQDGTPDGVYFPREQYVSMTTSAGQELYVYGYALPKN